MSDQHAKGPGTGHDHEPETFDREISVRPLVAFAVGLVVVIIVSGVAMWGLSVLLKAREEAQDRPLSPVVQREGAPPVPEPHLQTTPELDLKAMRAHEDSLLHSYAWVDRNAGVARIPVERAMELLVQQGLPTRAEPLPWTRPGTWRDQSLQRLAREGGP